MNDRQWTEHLQAAKEGQEASMIWIIQELQPKIQASLYQTSSVDREDLEQELIEKIVQIIVAFEIKEASTLWEDIAQERKEESANPLQLLSE